MQRLEDGTLQLGGARGEGGPWKIWQGILGRWFTNYPPPPGLEDRGEGRVGDPGYQRELTAAQYDALVKRSARDGREGGAAREAFFGFKPTGKRAEKTLHSLRNP